MSKEIELWYGSEPWPERNCVPWQDILYTISVYEIESIREIDDDFLRSKLSSDHSDRFLFDSGYLKVYEFFIDDNKGYACISNDEFKVIELINAMENFVDKNHDETWEISIEETELIFDRIMFLLD